MGAAKALIPKHFLSITQSFGRLKIHIDGACMTPTDWVDSWLILNGPQRGRNPRSINMAILVPITVFLFILVSTTVLGGIGCDEAAAARKK